LDEGYDTTLRDDDITKELMQPTIRSDLSPDVKGMGERTPHRYGWQAASDEGQYVASCYHEQRFQPTRESQRQGIRVRQQGTLFIHHQSMSANENLSESHTRSAGTYTLGVVSTLEKTVHTTNWELETSLARTRRALASLSSRACLSGR
jgi:hypothetical protein